MPYYTGPIGEGESYGTAEFIASRRRQMWEEKLFKNPSMLCAKFGEFLMELGHRDPWSQAQAARDGATFTDKNLAEKSRRELMTASSALDGIWMTDEGKDLWDLFLNWLPALGGLRGGLNV